MDRQTKEMAKADEYNGFLPICTSAGLDAHVGADVKLGCREVGSMLGIEKMPEGYALMLDADEAYFYWLRHDGAQSVISWDKWAAYRGAKDDAKMGN